MISTYKYLPYEYYNLEEKQLHIDIWKIDKKENAYLIEKNGDCKKV